MASPAMIKEAATVLCIRCAPAASAHLLSHKDVHLDSDAVKQLGDFEWLFKSGFQVLMGQSEVVNWLRSTPDHHNIMRYPGEFKFAGGTRDEGEELMQTATRELEEEFCLSLPSSAVLRLLRVNSTRAIQGVSHLMYNYVALSDENPWLEELDVDALNCKLSAKRDRFKQILQSGEFWNMTKQEKESVSPEVHKVEWVDIREAVRLALTSKGATFTPVNEYQRESFAQYHIQKRDPMYATMMTLLAVEAAGSLEGLRDASAAFEVKRADEIKRISIESKAQAMRVKGEAVYNKNGSRL